jgi:hypothetical protein
VFRSCIRFAAILSLLPCIASCEVLFDLNGLSDGGCDAACGGGSLDAALGSGDATQPADTGLASDAAAEAGPADAGADGAFGVDASEGTDSNDDAGCACLEQPPAPWQGPAALWEGSGSPPGCAGAYGAKVLDAFLDPVGPPAGCTCSCGAPAGATCASSASATLFSDHTCSTACSTVLLTTGTCPNVQGTCVNVFGIAADLQASGGTCRPQSTTDLAGWSWSGSMRACEPAEPAGRATCGASQVCLPMPAAPMELRPCILASGDLACPAGAYSVRHVYYGTASDTRGCAACTCGSATGVTCSATVQEGCGQTGPTFALPTTCASLADPGSVELTAVAAPSGGSCAPSAGQSTGSVIPASPTTVCCMP